MVVLGFAAALPHDAFSELSDAQKRQMFLDAREDIRPVPKPSPTETPRPKPKPAASPTPRSTPHPTPTPEREEDLPAPRPAPTATPVKKATPEEDVIALPEDTKPQPERPQTPPPPPKPTVTPPLPRLAPPPDAPIRIEKSGLEDQRGYEPATRPQLGGFFKRWRYLTPAVRKAIDRAQVQRGRWKYIILHNSGTRQGNARIFDVYHRRVRKMQNGLAYHFVIGNGSSSGNGEIEIGSRWTRQINGGHVASDYLNNIALGICLVGDLNRDLPTKDQLGALEELTTYLRGRVGRIKGRQAIVKGHKEINPKPTDCPGDRFDLRWLRKRFGS